MTEYNRVWTSNHPLFMQDVLEDWVENDQGWAIDLIENPQRVFNWAEKIFPGLDQQSSVTQLGVLYRAEYVRITAILAPHGQSRSILFTPNHPDCMALWPIKLSQTPNGYRWDIQTADGEDEDLWMFSLSYAPWLVDFLEPLHDNEPLKTTPRTQEEEKCHVA